MNQVGRLWVVSLCGLTLATFAHAQPPNPPFDEDGPPPEFGPGDFGGPGGPMGFGGPPGGMGGVQEDRKVVAQFDKDGDKRLNAAERKAAREFLAKDRANSRNRGPGRRPFGRNEAGEPGQPGPRISPADVKFFPDAPLYASNVLRTLFLEFEETDWEKELEDFHGTDVEVPARLTVDGKTYPDVGVHFRGASSYMMLGTGRKRSLNLSLDFAHEDQRLRGYRTLNLLNAHEDSSFLRTVLYYDVAREYVPAPKANFVRLVINGESWGVYVNVQQFNKDFVKEWFGTKKGARWKVPGSPQGRGSLAYLGEDAARYKRIYEIKTKDDPESWAGLIRLCKVLNETPADKLEEALAPLLDIDGALKFLALENVLVNNDGYWVRTSDYDLYQDEKGRFHVIPYDANETFSLGGGPGGGPGFGGGPGGPSGPGGFGPGMILAAEILDQADRNADGKLAREEFTGLADAWFAKLDPDKTGKLSQSQFVARLREVLPPPGAFGPPDGGPGTRGPPPGAFGPARFLGPALFAAVDASKDGSLTRAELKETFGRWFTQWDAAKSGTVNEAQLRTGLNGVLSQADFDRPGAGPGGRSGRRGPGGRGPGGGMRGGGATLDPLVAAQDTDKPLLSKLLAVPALRTRYLGYVRDLAEKWLDWNQLGPRALRYQALIADAVKADTRKLSSFDAFQKSVSGDAQAGAARGPERGGSLKSFAEQRRAYLLNHPQIKALSR
jgi:spore coat protein CotH